MNLVEMGESAKGKRPRKQLNKFAKKQEKGNELVETLLTHEIDRIKIISFNL